jgi:outer membrane cobalamin receptor
MMAFVGILVSPSPSSLLAETRLPSNVTVITPEEVRASRAQNLSEILENQPSLQVIRTGVFGSFAIVKIRGTPNASQVNILMNGLPLAGASRQFIDVARIPAENIDHIEIIKGAASALYPGDVSGGVINIVTRKPRSTSPDSHLSAQDRSKGTQVEELDFMERGNRFGGGLSYGRFRTNGLQVNSYAKLDSFDGLAQYNFPTLGEVEAEATVWDGMAGDPRGTPVDISQWNGTTEQQPVSEFTHTEETTKTGRLAHRRRWSQDVFSEWSLFTLQRDFRTMPKSGDVSPDYASRDSLVQTQFNLHLSNGLLAGGSFQSDDQSAVGGIFRHHDDHWNGFVIHSHRFGLWTEISRLEGEVQGQYDLSVNPRMTLMADPAPWLTLSANVGRSRRIPSFTERFYQLGSFMGNPGLTPEKTWTSDLGFQLRASSVTLSLTGFYARTDDRITVSPSSTTFVNSGLSEQRGLEIDLDVSWEKWENRASATFIRSRGDSAAGAGLVLTRLTPELSANDTLTYTFSPRWKMWGRVRALGDQYDQDNSQGTFIPGHTLYDAELIRRVWNAELFIRVENILDKRTAESTGFDPRLFGTLPGAALSPQLPRFFWAGITLHFAD